MENFMDIAGLAGTIQELLLVYGLNLLWAVIILVIGYWVAKGLSNLVNKGLTRAGIEPSLIKFATDLSYYLLMALVIVASLERVGVQTTSLIAVLGAAGLAIGLALQGSLSNFAAGVLILIFRFIKVGDYVEVAGADGFVEAIRLFTTTLVTRDNKTVIIPNSEITSSNIVNYSKKPYIRADMVFGIGYGDDLLKAKRILEEIVNQDERVLSNPPPQIAVLELGDSSVNFAVRPYVKIEHYIGIQLDTTEQVKLRFDEEGISIPFPQRDVHLFQEG